jgi:hypothetical protein
MMKTEFKIKMPGDYESPRIMNQEVVPAEMLCVSVDHEGYDSNEIELDFEW